MLDRILRRMRRKVRAREYVVTLHADEEMDEDGIGVLELECCILTGEIVGRQRDRDTKEWKYLVCGESADGEAVVVVAKLSPTGKLVILTVYQAKEDETRGL